MSGNGAETGSALVAAVIGIAVFAFLALQMLESERATLALIQARTDHAHLLAAADAGIAIALHGLAAENPEDRIAADGIAHSAYFDGMDIAITIEDDQGKIAINNTTSDVERRLFAAAGASGGDIDCLVDSLDDWKDYDDNRRPHGAEREYYAPRGIRTRNDAIRTLDELTVLPCMREDILARIAPAVALFSSRTGRFEADVASSPLALEAASGANSAYDVEKRLSLQAGQRPVLDLPPHKSLFGRFYTITVEARAPDGARAVRSVVVQYSGNAGAPYWYRMVQ